LSELLTPRNKTEIQLKKNVAGSASACDRQRMQIQNSRPRTVALDAVLTKDEWAKMVQACKDPVDQVILALGVLGLRASEIAECRREWVDLAQQTIHLPTEKTKRGKGRVVPFGRLRVVRDVLTSFFMLSKEVGLSRIAVYQRVKRIGSRAGLTHSVTPHGLRATGATWMAQAGYSLTGLQAHFGWSQIKTAAHYVSATGASAMRDMEAFGEGVL
jgi:integrase